MKHLLLIIIFFAFACEENSHSPEKEIIIQRNFTAINDPDLVIKNAVISSNNFSISIQYGGGCGEVQYDLYTDGLFMLSNPAQIWVELSFEDNDTCEDIVNEVISFDLSPLATHYRNSYRRDSGTLKVRLKGFDEIIRYDF